MLFLGIIIGVLFFVFLLLSWQKKEAFQSNIASLITTAIQKKQADKIGVYFLDLYTGQEIGVNDNEQFRPSSMLKVGLMMEYLRDAETNPTLLKTKLTDLDVWQTNTIWE